MFKNKPKVTINIESHKLEKKGRTLKKPQFLEPKEEWEKRLSQDKTVTETKDYYIIQNDAVKHHVQKEALNKIFS